MARTLAPAIGAGLVGAAAFWWVTVEWLCRDCGPGECAWDESCLGWLGVLLGIALVVLAMVIPYRLVEGRWPGRKV